MGALTPKTEMRAVADAPISGLIPTTLDEIKQIAATIKDSGLAPKDMDDPAKLVVAIMTGLEVGMKPIQAVQSIAVINGRPTIWGDGLIAIVRQSPACEYIREWIDTDKDFMVAYCETRRRGSSEIVTRSFSSDDAKRAKLWQTEAVVKRRARDGGYYETANDSPWYKYPQRMLQMRARAWCLRDVYADVLKGMQVREEVMDYYASEAARDVTPQKSQERLGPSDGPLARILASRAPAPSQDIKTHVQNEISGVSPPAPESPASEDVSAPSRSEESGVGPAATPADERAAGPFFTGADAARVKVIAEALRGAVSDEDVNEVFRVHLKPLGKEHPVVKGVSVLFSLTRDRITGDADPDQFNEALFQLVGGE